SHAGACTLDGHRTRGSALRAGRRGGPARWHEPHRPAVHPETRTQREAARLAVPVLEHHTCTPPLFSTRTTAPTQPVCTSSTTRPFSAGASCVVGRNRECGSWAK